MRFVGSDASLVKTSRVGDVPAKTFEVVGVSGVGATRSARGVQRRHLIPGVDLKGRDIFDLPTLSPLASSLSPHSTRLIPLTRTVFEHILQNK